MPEKAEFEAVFAFGARIGKAYISRYFMSVYSDAIRGMSPALKKRMQGKACFNFTKRDPELFSELSHVRRQGHEGEKLAEWSNRPDPCLVRS